MKKRRIIMAYKEIMTLVVQVASQEEMRNHRSVVVPNEVIPWRGRHIFHAMPHGTVTIPFKMIIKVLRKLRFNNYWFYYSLQ